MADLKETILKEHQALERVKKFKDELQEIGSNGAILSKLGIFNKEETKQAMTLAILGDVLENIIDGMDPDNAIVDTIMQKAEELELDLEVDLSEDED